MSNGLALGCSDHFSGSISDIDILHRMEHFHQIALEKQPNELNITDIGAFVDKYSEHWAFIADKGYQGSGEFLRSVVPKKKPRNGFLSPEDEARNRKIASDRIIVENFFGHLCGNRNVLSSKYRWAENCYDVIFRLCLGMNNLYVKWHPLRADDLDRFQRFKNRQYSIGEGICQKRRKSQEKYRAKRKRRMDIEFHGRQASDEETELDI